MKKRNLLALAVIFILAFSTSVLAAPITAVTTWDFNDTPVSTVPDGWTKSTHSNWRVNAEGKFQSQISGGTVAESYAFVGETTDKISSISADIRLDTISDSSSKVEKGDFFGLAIGFSGKTESNKDYFVDFYGVRAGKETGSSSTNRFAIFKYSNGVETILVDSNMSSDNNWTPWQSGYNMKMTISEGVIKLYIGGSSTARLTYFDPSMSDSYITGRAAVIMKNTGTGGTPLHMLYDNVVVEPYLGTETSENKGNMASYTFDSPAAITNWTYKLDQGLPVGIWSVIDSPFGGSVYKQAETDKEPYSISPDESIKFRDYSAEVLVRVVSDPVNGSRNSARLYFGFKGPGNHYYAQFDDDKRTGSGRVPTYSIHRVKETVDSTLDNCSVQTTAWAKDSLHKMKVVLYNSILGKERIELWVDGELICTSNDSNAREGNVGVGTRNFAAEFDNLLVTKIPTPVKLYSGSTEIGKTDAIPANSTITINGKLHVTTMPQNKNFAYAVALYDNGKLFDLSFVPDDYDNYGEYNVNVTLNTPANTSNVKIKALLLDGQTNIKPLSDFDDLY